MIYMKRSVGLFSHLKMASISFYIGYSTKTKMAKISLKC